MNTFGNFLIPPFRTSPAYMSLEFTSKQWNCAHEKALDVGVCYVYICNKKQGRESRRPPRVIQADLHDAFACCVWVQLSKASVATLLKLHCHRVGRRRAAFCSKNTLQKNRRVKLRTAAAQRRRFLLRKAASGQIFDLNSMARFFKQVPTTLRARGHSQLAPREQGAYIAERNRECLRKMPRRLFYI